MGKLSCFLTNKTLLKESLTSVKDSITRPDVLITGMYFPFYAADDVKKKWRGMPDTFRKYLTKQGGESSIYGADIQANSI
jgi:hypothetical protein